MKLTGKIVPAKQEHNAKQTEFLTKKATGVEFSDTPEGTPNMEGLTIITGSYPDDVIVKGEDTQYPMAFIPCLYLSKDGKVTEGTAQMKMNVSLLTRTYYKDEKGKIIVPAIEKQLVNAKALEDIVNELYESADVAIDFSKKADVFQGKFVDGTRVSGEFEEKFRPLFTTVKMNKAQLDAVKAWVKEQNK